MPDGSERPVGFLSCMLTDAEQKYSQIEKEVIARVYGVTRFTHTCSDTTSSYRLIISLC